MRKRRKPQPAEVGTMYLCIVEAVANEAEGFRCGAHHALVVILSAASAEAAGQAATGIVNDAGWMLAELERVEDLTAQSSLMENDTLQEAVSIARLRGHCIAVEREEIPLDS